ncbi:hypothetical protein A6K76_01985 [Caryophanon latum]|uniref:Uncharacterized protein n=1 Tax=Caryophanon latum TaxID=33977 RepID=A0A1C0YUM8_9BACL|nr:hypothetical protein A6K76_01985 [Caryophanon latum]
MMKLIHVTSFLAISIKCVHMHANNKCENYIFVCNDKLIGKSVWRLAFPMRLLEADQFLKLGGEHDVAHESRAFP